LKLHPGPETLKLWHQLVPTKGDLLFFPKKFNRVLVEALSAAVFTADEIRAQSQELWTLPIRSFYTYTLNRSAFCAFFPAGRLELLSDFQRGELAATQISGRNPALLRAKLTRNLLQAKGHTWITSASFHALSTSEKTKTLAAWATENKLTRIYDFVKLSSLPEPVQEQLDETGLSALANTFHHRSGPNCLGAVAFAASSGTESGLLNLWLHSSPFQRILSRRGFRPAPKAKVEAGDILVCEKKGEIIHAAYALGRGFLFEKPGQDCYEPYRIAALEEWKKEWGKYSIWRKYHR
jgi:hypothetical protein